MKRLLFILTLFACGLMFMVFLGCSNDDEDTNPIVQGNPDSEEFQFYQDVVSDPAMEINRYALFTTMALLDSFVLPEIPGKPGPRYATAEGEPLIVFDSVVFDTSNFWITFYFEFTVINTDLDFSETLYVYGTDSLQVFENNETVYIPVGEPDSIDAREHFHLAYNSTDDMQMNAAGHHSLRIGNTYPDSTIFNAYSLDSLMTYFVPENPGLSLCSLRVVSETDIDNLALALSSVDANGDICPLAGGIDLTTNLNLGCVGDSAVFNINGEWKMSLSFANGMQYTTVTYGNTVWHSEEICE
jgi:hypothetical protein